MKTTNLISCIYIKEMTPKSATSWNSNALTLIMLIVLFFLSLNLDAQGLEVNQGTSLQSDQTGGYALIGDRNGRHLAIDGDDLQARFHFGVNSLSLNKYGGSVDLIGSSNSTGNLTVDGSGLFYQNLSDRVGIGTFSPRQRLDVRGRTITTGLDLDGVAYFSATADDGLIRSIDGAGADLFLITNDQLIIELDNDNDEAGGLSIYNGANDIIFSVDEAGHTKVGSGGNGNTLLTLDSERSWSFKQYGTGASSGLQLTPTDPNNANKPFVINSTANVGIGSDLSPDYKLEVIGTAGKPGGGSWSNSSDKRLKKDIRAFEEGLDLVKSVKPIYFHYNGKDNLPTDQEYVGVIAQELKKSAPFMVSEYAGDDGETYLAVDPSAFDFVLINAVKELSAELDKIKKELFKYKQEQSYSSK